MNDISTVQKRRDVDEYGITTRGAKKTERPSYDWIKPTETKQEEYLRALLISVERSINELARDQYTMPRSEYNARMASLFEQKRIVTAFLNPYNLGLGPKGHPALGCTWMRTWGGKV